MRWHVHGTDSLTGQDVELALDEQEASRAVKAAIDRHILVSHVTRAGRGWGGWMFAMFTVMVAAVVCGGLWIREAATRRNLQQAMAEQSRLSRSVAGAEQTVKDLRDHGNLAASASTQMTKLAEELAISRSRISLTNLELSDARNRVDALEQAAAQVPALEKKLVALHEQLADAQTQLKQSRQMADQLRTEGMLQSRRLGELEQLKPSDEAVAKIAQLDTANKALAGQIEKLKGELLIAAAQTTAAGPAPERVVTAGVPLPALAISCDAARDFFNLTIDHETAVATSTGSVVTESGVAAANVVRLEFSHDRARERVYSATLTVSLASGAPRDRLEENRKTIAEFLATFAPALKAPADVVAATSQLAGKDESRRMVFLASGTMVTLWNDKTGVFTLHVESARREAQ